MPSATQERTKEKSFEDFNKELGLESGAKFPPFLNLYGQVGNWAVGQLLAVKSISYTPKKGKMKGKKVTKTVYTMLIDGSNIDDIVTGQEVTISPAGLLSYQLSEDRPEGKFPMRVGIRYTGRDSEDRHQTEVSWSHR